MNHIVAVSGGKDSTAMALRLAEAEPRDYIYICTPTGDELPELLNHWDKLEARLGQPLVRVTNRTLTDWIDHFNALPNGAMRWCTRLLKIEPCLAYVKTHQPATLYVGLRADEEERKGVYSELVMNDFPLRRWGWGLREVQRYNRGHNMTPPARTDCARCFYQRLPEWYRLWIAHPDVYAEAEAQERKTGFTFRRPHRDTWPTSLRDLRAEFEKGAVPVGATDWRQGELCRVCSL